MNRSPLSRSIQLALVGSSLLLAMPGLALAQSSPEEETATLDTVQVTGSRLKRAEIEGAAPVTVITRAQIDMSGDVSVADVLQRISSNGAALNSTFNNGGDGSAGISLRNLGEGRTLVLVNGRRWTQGLGGSVDLNTIQWSAH